MSILIVDDLQENRLLLQAVLATGGYTEILSAASVEEMHAHLKLEDGDWRSPVDLILMDYMMPGVDGIEAVRRVKQSEALRDIPVILVTGYDAEGVLEAAFAAGVMDYIAKPIDTVELLARIRSALTLKREMDIRKERERELLAVTKKLAEVNDALQRLSALDGLTGIANRRSFDDIYDREWRRCRREQEHLSVLMIDIDCFKAFNDAHGHLRGDDCLRAVAAVLDRTCHRPGDLAARYGGEEFVVVLGNTAPDGARVVAESLRSQVQELGIAHARSVVADVVTISVGAASVLPGDGDSPEMLLAAADRALYAAKKLGRNRVEAADLGRPAA